MIHFSDLLRPDYYIPAARCAGLGFVLFLAAWWLPSGRRSGGFALLLLGLAWALCHLMVNPNSYVYLPKDPADWLLFGALGIVPIAVVVWLRKRGEGGAAVLAGVLLGVTAWLALQKLSWLLDRAESPRERWLWTSGIISAVLAAFGAAEASARKVPAVLMLAALAIFIGLAGLALLQLTMPERITARLLAVAALTAGAAIAGLLHHLRRHPVPTLPPGIAGWIAGGSVLLFILGCLSRASGVPLLPIEIAAATLPVATLLLYTCGRILGGNALIFALVMIGGGVSLTAFAARDRDHPAAVSSGSSPTGADDSGAYDDL